MTSITVLRDSIVGQPVDMGCEGEFDQVHGLPEKFYLAIRRLKPSNHKLMNHAACLTRPAGELIFGNNAMVGRADDLDIVKCQ